MRAVLEAKLEIAKAVAVVEAAKEKEKADIAALKSKYDTCLAMQAQISAEKEASTLAKDLEKAKVGHGGSNIVIILSVCAFLFSLFLLIALCTELRKESL